MQSTLDPTPQTVETGYIDIVTNQGVQVVSAEIYGPWAIHRSGSQWKITSVGLGLVVASLWHRAGALWLIRNLPPAPEKTAGLRQWRSQLVELVDIAEAFGNPVNSSLVTLNELLPAETRNRIRKALTLLDALVLPSEEGSR